MNTKIENGRRRALSFAEQAALAARRAAWVDGPENTALSRTFAKRRAREYAASLIRTNFEEFTQDDLPALRWIHTATLPAARSDELTEAAAVYQYAVSVLSAINSMTRAEADAYSPPADPGWPS